MSEAIYFYSKHDPYYELSNFYPFGFADDEGRYWPTVEHYFQAMKFSGEAHAAYREKIRLARSPSQAKKLGRSREVPLRKDWEQVKDEVMLTALRLKFQHPKMQKVLAATNDHHLYENAPADTYWGIGQDHSGKNRLGKLLMQVREEQQKP